MTKGTNGRFPWERQKMTAAGYARDLNATRDLPYGEKFADFFRLCEQGEQGEFQIVVAAFPEILGDNYGELVSNLWRCAKAGLLVAFANTMTAGAKIVDGLVTYPGQPTLFDM